MITSIPSFFEKRMPHYVDSSVQSHSRGLHVVNRPQLGHSGLSFGTHFKYCISQVFMDLHFFFFFKCDKAQLITSVRISGELIVQSVWFHLTKQGFDLQIYIYNENLSSSQWNWFYWTKNHLIYINYIIFSN